MTVPVDRPLEEWAVSRALFPTRLIQERCARKKKEEQKVLNMNGIRLKMAATHKIENGN